MTAVDALRIVVAGVGLILAGYYARPLWKATTNGQRARALGIALLLVAVSAGRLERLGDPPNWELWLVAAAEVVLVFGFYSFTRWENPAEHRDDPPPGLRGVR